MNRRTFLKSLFSSIVALLGVSSGGYLYARHVETKRLDITYETIQDRLIPHTFDGFKILQFSDTHIGFHYSLDQFAELVQTINDLKPHLIVFTGDLIDKPQYFNDQTLLSESLKQLSAPYGKYWVYGNHDHGGYGTEMLGSIMEQAHFQLLKNKHTVIEKGVDRIIIAGIDDAILGKPDLQVTLENVHTDLYTILLAHEPDFADTTAQYAVNLQLSGHSHGGQVRLPFIGHLYTPNYAEKYIDGHYQIHESLDLFVNRGIGTTRMPLRFFCKPELSIYTLKSITE